MVTRKVSCELSNMLEVGLQKLMEQDGMSGDIDMYVGVCVNVCVCVCVCV